MAKKIKKIYFELKNENAIKRLTKDGKIVLPKKKISIPKDRRWNEDIFNKALIAGLESGSSVKDISKKLMPEIMSKTNFTGKTQQEIYGKGGVIAKNRESSIRNARTMFTSAENHGRLDSYKDLSDRGVVMKKEWQATPDDRTRTSHIDIDGEEQDIDTVFSNGCMFPGDGKGPSEEVWMCRCAMGTHIIGFRKPDGSISRINYTRNETLHDKQMSEEKERRRKDG